VYINNHFNRFQDDSAASTTITMQDIINHGVEKSLQEMPVCHGKTSSKYYSEVLGLEYSGTEDSSSCSSSSDAQPLDLSPVKKKAVNPIQIRALEDNPLLSQPPLPRSPRPFGQGSSAVSSLPPSQPPPSSKPPPVHPELFPAWKKQRTETASGIPAAPSQAPSHRALPPISGLQKPPVFSLAAGNPASSPYRHSSWIRDSLSSRPADLTAAKKPATSDPATLHGQLSMLHGQNGRTV
jgi:hypothetical protein